MKNLSALAVTSTLGCASILCTVLFVVIRALDKTYRMPLLASKTTTDTLTAVGDAAKSAAEAVVASIVSSSSETTKAGGGGKFVTDGTLKFVPKFEKESLWNMDFTSLVLASNMGLAYM
jgi:hypothetical protein